MISKFLYDIDVQGKKVLYGLLEDELEGKIELGSEIEYSFMGDVTPEDISRNLGGQCFVVFDDNGTKKYLDIDFYKDKAKIQLSEKIQYAFPISEDLIDIILDYLDVNLKYEVIYGCFYEHPKKGTVDILEKQFKGLFTDSYVQVIKEGISYFLSYNEEYFLTRNLREAKKFHKSEIRKILIINKFVDKTTELKQLYFSPYQLLRGEDEFFMLYPKPMMVSKVEEDFIINTKEIKITNNHLLCKSELINGKMKEIQSLLNKDDEFEKGYGLCYSKFLEVKEDRFTLNSNPSKLSLVSKSCISLFSSIYSIFSETEVKYIPEQNIVYAYEIEENKFKLTNNNIDDFVFANIIKDNVYYDYLKYFITNNNKASSKGYVLSCDSKYISIKILDNNEFYINYNNSSYDASVFTLEQAKVLESIINRDLTRRELTNILTNLDKYNITSQKSEFNIVNEYKSILQYTSNNRIKLNMYNDNVLKLENEKGSLEYLRRYYFKDICDSELLFTNIFTKHEVTNVLLVDSPLNLDLIALNNAAVKMGKKINVTMIIRTKMGYLPKTSLSNVTVDKIYRVEFASLPKAILKDFDLILFSRNFQKQDISFDFSIKQLVESQNIILANIKHCGIDKVQDSFANIFNMIKRKHFIDYENSTEIVSLSREIFKDSYENISYTTKFSEVVDPIVEKKFSYHSIVVIKDKKVYDFYK